LTDVVASYKVKRKGSLIMTEDEENRKKQVAIWKRSMLIAFCIDLILFIITNDKIGFFFAGIMIFGFGTFIFSFIQGFILKVSIFDDPDLEDDEDFLNSDFKSSDMPKSPEFKSIVTDSSYSGVSGNINYPR
jgi:hypothetical protein